MVPQTVARRVFPATCWGHSFPDPHRSCRPALPASISAPPQGPVSTRLDCLGLSVPIGRPQFPLPLPDRRVVCKLGPSKAMGRCVPSANTLMEPLRWGWALMVWPREHSAHPPPNVQDRVVLSGFLPPLPALLNLSTAKAVDLEAISFLSTSSPFLPASPDPGLGLQLRAHGNLGLSAADTWGS